MAARPDSAATAPGSKPTPSSATWTAMTSPSRPTVTATAEAPLWRHTLCSASWTTCSSTVSVTQSRYERLGHLDA